MGITSNIDDVERYHNKLFASIDMTMKTRVGSLGKDISEGVATGIETRSYEGQRGASQTPWPENSDKPEGHGYKSKKKKKYGTGLTNYRTRQMLSSASLLGKVDIAAKEVRMVYGTGTPPTEGYNGYIEEKDKLVTDQEKAEWAHEQGRPFFELDQVTTDAVMEVCEDAIGQYLQDAANQ